MRRLSLCLSLLLVSLTAAASEPNLVAHWKFNESTGTTAADSSGNNNTVTLFSGATFAAGKIGASALSCDGINDTARTNGNLNLSGTNVITVSFWLNWTNYTNDDDLAMMYTPNFNGSTGGFLIDPNSSQQGGTRFEVALRGDAGYNQCLFARPSAGVWHHYAIIFDKGAPAATEITPYVDGAAVPYTQFNAAENTNNFASSVLNFMSTTGSLFGAGRMDDVKIYSRALSAAEILELSKSTPAVTSITPDIGTAGGGTTVTITGQRFDDPAQVTFDGLNATEIKVVNSTTITARTPAHPAATVDVKVTNPNSESATLSKAFVYNAAPVITSPLSCSPNPPAAGQTTFFSLGAIDPENRPLKITYSYGDGTIDNLGRHVYSAPGLYTVVVTIADELATISTSLNITVVSAAVPPVFQMTINSMKNSVKFGASGRDSCQITVTVPNLPTGFVFAGKTVVIDVGGARTEFTINDKLAAKTPTGTLKLKAKFAREKSSKRKVFSGGPATFQIKFTGTWQQAWLNEGINPANSTKNAKINMPAFLTLDGKTYSDNATPSVTSVAGKSAKMSFKR